MIHRYGVKYPSGTYSGPIADSLRDAARYGKPYHGVPYEVGSADDPAPEHQTEAPPWDFDGTSTGMTAEDVADMENDRRKCYGVSLKFGGT